uniref:Transposase n=1 Tax=Chenopodium quinoa TaxID=63459 RepID=A0A803LJ03_CHEQI
MFNRPRRNEDGVSNIYNYLYKSGGRVVGKKENVRSDDRSLKQAHRYVLLHYDELTPVLNEFLKLKRQENDVGGSQANESIENQWIIDDFADWLQSQVHNLDDSTIEAKLRKALASGLSNRGKRMKSVIINGYKFDIVDRERFRITQNSGIMVEAKDHEYYGKLKEILELDYYAIAPQTNQERQKSGKESEKIPKQSKALRPKALPDWPLDIDFDDKEEVLTIDANGNTTLVSGIILPIDFWSNNGVQYYVEFNDLCQPIRKGGHILVKFVSMIAKMESCCPVGEKYWHAIDNHFKGKIITDIREHFVIPLGAEYDNQALKSANKCWRQYKYSLKQQYYKPEQKTLDQICNNVPHGITSSNWEDEHGQKMSLLELWIKTHTGKDRSFLPSTVTEDFVDDVKDKVEELRMIHPKMSEQELEDEAFQQTMYGNEIPDRPVGYGLEILGAVRQGNASPDLLNKASEFLGKEKHQ